MRRVGNVTAEHRRSTDPLTPALWRPAGRVADQPIQPRSGRRNNCLMTKARASVVSVLALLSLVTLVVTAVEPDWVEEAFGVEPDAGSGLAEALVTGLLVMITVVLAASAVLTWRAALRRSGRRPLSPDRRSRHA
jgi:hypothetical protein